MNTIPVTAATGNVGSGVVRELQSHKANVRALVRDPAAAAARFRAARLPDLDLATGDFEDPGSLRPALDGVSHVYLSAADGPHETAMIDAAADVGVELIVKLSAMHADPGSRLPAYRWHGEIEVHVARSGVPAVILRPAFFMTNLLMVAGGWPTPAPSTRRPRTPIAMIDIRDVAAVAAVTLTADGHQKQTYELTGPVAVTFTDVARALAEVTGRPVTYVDLSEGAARPRFEGAGLPDWLAEHLAGVFAVIRDDGFAHTTDHVAAITGRPARGIADFARDHSPRVRPSSPLDGVGVFIDGFGGSSPWCTCRRSARCWCGRAVPARS